MFVDEEWWWIIDATMRTPRLGEHKHTQTTSDSRIDSVVMLKTSRPIKKYVFHDQMTSSNEITDVGYKNT